MKVRASHPDPTREGAPMPDHDRATRVATYLATNGWTITPAQENP